MCILNWYRLEHFKWLYEGYYKEAEDTRETSVRFLKGRKGWDTKKRWRHSLFDGWMHVFLFLKARRKKRMSAHTGKLELLVLEIWAVLSWMTLISLWKAKVMSWEWGKKREVRDLWDRRIFKSLQKFSEWDSELPKEMYHMSLRSVNLKQIV